MKKSIIIILIPFLFTACFDKHNVCPSEIKPRATVYDDTYSSENNTASLSQIDANNNTIYKYELEYIANFDGTSYKNVFFNEDIGIAPNSIYRFQYNDDVYFVYDIALANSDDYQDCGLNTTYVVNGCELSGLSLSVPFTCAIPTDQADEYFETNIKSTLK